MPSSGPRPWAENLHQALREHERLRLSLGITPEDAARAIPEDLLLGRLAVEKKLINPEMLEACLKEQAEVRREGEDLLLGDLLARRNVLSPKVVEDLLKEQKLRLQGLPEIARYEIQSRLGEGAMGIVYRALDRELH